MTTAVDPQAAAALVRWQDWRARYTRSSRRSDLQARIVALVMFGVIMANLVVQLFSRYV